jgi:hypothetical protein
VAVTVYSGALWIGDPPGSGRIADSGALSIGDPSGVRLHLERMSIRLVVQLVRSKRLPDSELAPLVNMTSPGGTTVNLGHYALALIAFWESSCIITTIQVAAPWAAIFYISK